MKFMTRILVLEHNLNVCLNIILFQQPGKSYFFRLFFFFRGGGVLLQLFFIFLPKDLKDTMTSSFDVLD